MNTQLGLQRVSAVWWGFWGLVGLAVGFGALFTQSPDKAEIAGVGAIAAVAAYVGHRTTCWILAGFFSPPRS